MLPDAFEFRYPLLRCTFSDQDTGRGIGWFWRAWAGVVVFDSGVVGWDANALLGLFGIELVRVSGQGDYYGGVLEPRGVVLWTDGWMFYLKHG